MPWWMSSTPAPAAAPTPVPAASATQHAGTQPHVVEATVVGVVPAQPPPAPPQPPPQPQRPQERVPEAPGSFPKLDSMPVEELQRLQATSIVMDDFLHELPQAKALRSKLKEVMEKNCGLAADVLGREEEYDRAAEQLEKGRAALKERTEAMQALAKERDQILKQRSPQLMAAALAAKSHEADNRAEEMLSEVVSASGNMDASALSKFRQRFVQEKMEKHWRLAMKESLEKGVAVGTTAS